MTPGLISARLRLTPYTASMVTDQQVAWLNRYAVVKYSEQRHKTHTIQSQHRFLNEFPVGSHIWLIKIENTGKPIGSITAYIDKWNSLANMGILIGEKSLWGKGYGFEAWDLVMDYLFKQKIRKIECGCASVNLAMKNIAISAGMVHEATVKEHFMIGKELIDLELYGLIWHDMYHEGRKK